MNAVPKPTIWRPSLHVGSRVRLRRPIIAIVDLPQGTQMDIVRMEKHYGLRSPVCPCCGLQARLGRVLRADVDLLPDVEGIPS